MKADDAKYFAAAAPFVCEIDPKGAGVCRHQEVQYKADKEIASSSRKTGQSNAVCCGVFMVGFIVGFLVANFLVASMRLAIVYFPAMVVGNIVQTTRCIELW